MHHIVNGVIVGERKDIKVVIFGHSHNIYLKELDLDDPSGRNPFNYTKVYANCGTWSSGQTPIYIEIEPDKNPAKCDQVRLLKWEKGKPRLLGTKFFDPGG